MIARLAVSYAIFAMVPVAGYAQQQKVKLEYKLRAGERVVSRVVHQADTQTNISDSYEESSSQTISIKVWEVQSADSDSMTFVYSIDEVDMKQSIGKDVANQYNSSTDQAAPKVFQRVAETVRKPLATITIDRTGEVLKRDKELKSPLMGIGDLTIPLPKEAVAVGAQWQVNRDLRVRLDDGTFKVIKTRELYRLEKVSAGVATISMTTQPLTPVTDPTIEAQLVQQLSEGTIKFDIDSGRLLSKTLDWEENVIGFRGAESSMRYNATWSEELLPAQNRAATAKDLKR